MEGGSNFNPVAVALLLVLMCLTWSLRRRYAVCPLLISVCLIPLGQELVVLGLHFQFFRLLLVVAGLRVIARREAAGFEWGRIDKYFLWWMIVSLVFAMILEPSLQTLINKLGELFNAGGCYFIVRCCIVDFDDVVATIRVLGAASIPVAALMLMEKVTTHNLLSILGGVPEITVVREGHLRCQGAFRHPILAGTFGATLFPLLVGAWFVDLRWRRLLIGGIISSCIIVVTSSSSGPALALLSGMVGFILWRYRRRMRFFRRATVIVLIGLHLCMKAPVWYLLARISDVIGGGGWHRAWLIDQAISHFGQWWFFGTTSTANWAPGNEILLNDANNMDITNQFVAEGIEGGIVRLTLFVAVIVQCFKLIGRTVQACAEQSPARGLFFWSVGIALSAHCISFISVTYYDQIVIIWYWLLGTISSSAHFVSEEAPRTEPEPLAALAA